MDKEELKKSVAVNLRCVTQSSKDGVNLVSLQSDYKGLIGKEIPFKELGYSSLEAFLLSIPDVVRLIRHKDGLCMVEAVADSSTAHIASLISKQKNSKNAKKGNSKKPSVPVRKYHESWRSPSNNSEGISKVSTSNSPNTKVPLTKQKNIGASTPTTSKQTTNQNNVVSEHSKVKKLNPPTPASKLKKNEVTIVSEELPSNSNDLSYMIGLSNARTTLKKINERLKNSSETPLTKSQRNTLKVKRRKLNKKLTKTKSEIKKLKEKCVPMISLNEIQDSCTTLSVPTSIQMKQLKKFTLMNLQTLLLSKKDGVLLNNLQRDYQNLFGIPIPYNELKYNSLEAFAQDIPDVINLKINKDGQIYIQAIRDEETNDISNEFLNQCAVESIPPPVPPTTALPSFHQREPSPSNFQSKTVASVAYKPSLNCFPRIKSSITSATLSSLLVMNLLLFGDDSYMETLKRGILSFDGFDFVKGSTKWKEREIMFSMLPEETLKECLSLLCIDCKSKDKREMIHKLLQFLASPSSSSIVNRKTTEEDIKKENVGSNSKPNDSSENRALKTVKKIQEYIHTQK